MNKNKIIHIMVLDKFLVPFIDLVDEHFGRDNHHYVFITSEKYEYELTANHKVEFLHTDDDIFITLLEYMKISKKIILHGLWRDKVDILLYFNQDLLKKCYWIMWGGDFYFPESKSKIRHKVIKEMGHFITFIKDDYLLAQKWYGSQGKYNKCFTYPSNLYKNYGVKIKENTTINIQLGNSATETNNHFELLQNLVKYKNENIKIFIPLSYGNQKYAEKVIEEGEKLFADKIVPLREFMVFEQYLEFLSTIDIAIFAHKRQQAMGNSISILGLGKKVYLDPKSVQFNFFRSHGIDVFDINEINLEKINQKISFNNQEKVKYLFSHKVLIEGLEKIFNE